MCIQYTIKGGSWVLETCVCFTLNWSLGSDQPRASSQCPRVSLAAVHRWCLGAPRLWSSWRPPLAECHLPATSPTSSRKPLQTTLPSLSLSFSAQGQWLQVRLPASPSSAASEPVGEAGTCTLARLSTWKFKTVWGSRVLFPRCRVPGTRDSSCPQEHPFPCSPPEHITCSW